jgi:hypothetical protein
MHEDMVLFFLHVTQNEYLIEHVVFPLENDESTLFPSNFHSNLNSYKEFSAQENYQQFQENFASLNCSKEYNIYGLFQR